ncbi:hypothetical protein M5D96_010081, partial [Drosophila gunungcola]
VDGLGNKDCSIPGNGDNCTTANIAKQADPRANMLNIRLHLCDNIGVLKRSPNLKTVMIDSCTRSDLDMTVFASLPNLHLVHLNLINCGPLRELHMQSAGTVNLRSSWIKRLEIAGGSELSTVAVLGITDYEQPCEGFNCTSTAMVDTYYSYQKAFDLVEHRLDNCSNLGVLKASPNLEILQIYNCSSELVDLNLARNQIATLKFKTFSENPKLKWLCLRDNPLIMVLAIPLKRLVLLDLTNCRPLEELQMHSAETVILENGGVRKMDVAGSVSILYARKNRLRYIQLDDKMSVTELYLSDNMMQTKELQKILMGMWRLQRLDLSCNIINELPVPHSDNLGEVFLLPNLRLVNLSSNMLEYLQRRLAPYVPRSYPFGSVAQQDTYFRSTHFQDGLQSAEPAH